MFKTTIGTILLTTLAAAGPRNSAPEFKTIDSNGASVRLSDYKGKVVLLNFWATWCGGCKLEIPWLIDFEKRYGDEGLAVIGVSMDDDGWKLVKPFIAEKGINYPVILGRADLAKSYSVDSMPRTLLIDRSGRIAASHTGVVDRTGFEGEIRALLKEAIQSPFPIMSSTFPTPVRAFQTGGLSVRVYRDRDELGRAAAEMISGRVRAALTIILASAPSQTETLQYLSANQAIDWTHVSAFHLDEYAGAKETDPHSFRKFLQDHFLSKVTLKKFHPLRGEATDLEAACRDYARLLRETPPQFALLGIGENGHLAFNDPPVADFHDPLDVKVVELDIPCREQQVHDGAFAQIADVPTHALTLTVPSIMRVPELFAMVPGPRKKNAVRDAIEGPISTDCPASILRTHHAAHLFLDADSAALLA